MAGKRTRETGGGAPKVMVVDARGDELQPVCEQLRASGLEVAMFSRAEAAVYFYRAFRPDVAVLAANAPKFSEIALGKQLRLASGGALPLFYLVDNADSFSRTYVMQKGFALDVLTRPVECEELCAKITAHVRVKRSIERLAHEHTELKAPTLRDRATGLHNRAYFVEAINTELRRCSRHGGSFTVAAFRLERLERFAKHVGLERAQKVLMRLASLLTDTLREADSVARVGTAEFASLLPKAPAESWSGVQSRLRERFEAERLSVDVPARARLSLSLGASFFPDVVGNSVALMNAASADLRKQQVPWVVGA